jgi:hypothetical protein
LFPELEWFQKELKDQRELEGALRLEASFVAARLRAAPRGAVSSCAADLNRDLEWYRTEKVGANPAALADWEAAAWADYDQARLKFPRRLRAAPSPRSHWPARHRQRSRYWCPFWRREAR